MAADLATQITNLARQKYGEEGARVVAAILQVEGGLTGNVGDNGNAFGPFQFHKRGELPAYAKARGLTLEQAGQKARTDPLDAATWALDNYLGQTLQKGLQAGVKGSRLATYVQQYAQRSEKPERAGQAYQSMYGSGSQEGGSNVMPRGEDQERSPQDTAVANYEAKIAKWEEEKTAAEVKLADLREKMALADPATFQGSETISALSAQARSYESRVNSLDTNIRNAMAQMERIRTQKDQRYAQDRQRQQDDRQRQQDQLNTYKDLLTSQIEAGRLTMEQARLRWDQIMDLAAQGRDVTEKILQYTMQAAPRMGDKNTQAAYQNLLRGWNPYIANPFPEQDFLPIIPFDPQKSMQPYLPPADAMDWESAKKAMLEAQVTPQEVPDIMRQYREEALLGSQPPAPDAPTAPEVGPSAVGRPEGPPGWEGPPPGRSTVTIPGARPSPITRQGPPGWEGPPPAVAPMPANPSPAPPPAAPSTVPVPMDPEIERYAREAAADFARRRQDAAVPKPTPTPRTRYSEDIFNDPNLSPEQRLEEFDRSELPASNDDTRESKFRYGDQLTPDENALSDDMNTWQNKQKTNYGQNSRRDWDAYRRDRIQRRLPDPGERPPDWYNWVGRG